MKIINLEVNDLTNPIGYDYESISLSWQVVEAISSFSREVQVIISKTKDMKSIVYDSKIVKNFKNCNYSLSMELEPRTRYYWQVWVRGEHDEAVSEVAFFETGKISEKWNAEWIGVTESNKRMPCIYKNFWVQTCKSARIYIYGVGIYEAYLNGNKISKEFLLPGYHSYDFIMEYQTFDITDIIQEGDNCIEVILGEGWYKGRFGFDGVYHNLYGNQKKCIVEIYITDQEGKEILIPSNNSWKAIESNILQNSIYDGEWIDETLEQKKLKVEVITDSKESLVERSNPPIIKTKQHMPVKVIQHPDGYELYDFGKILTGWVEINANFNKGQEISLYYGELLQEDSFYNENLRTAKAEFHYISKGGLTTVRPHFTYYGFRYVKVIGIKNIQMEEILAYQITSDIKEIGSITTSNEKVNQLFANTIQSQRCNFLDIPTDCPQRDERMGWTGDVAIFARTACFHMKSGAFFHHYLTSLRKEQDQLNGSIPFFVPTPKIEPHEGINPFYTSSGVSVWGDVATILPWTLYQYYGNKNRLREYYPIMTRWVDSITEKTKTNPIPNLWQDNRQLGDWLALDNGDVNNPIGRTDTGLIASAYYYYSVSLCAKAAREIQNSQEEKYNKLASQIKEAFLTEFFDKNNKLNRDFTQTACAVLLFMGLYPEEGKQSLINELEKLLKENDYHLNTGFVGTPILCPVLSENGLNDLAYKLLLKEDYPSWLYEVNLGATTIWERWNSLLEDGRISGTDMNSLNHYAYGSIADWMYRYMCGFHPSMEQDIKMIIKPMPNNKISEVKGQWNSPYGIYKCEWSLKNEIEINYKVEIPFNSNAKVIVNNKIYVLEAGTYYFNHNGDFK